MSTFREAIRCHWASRTTSNLSPSGFCEYQGKLLTSTALVWDGLHISSAWARCNCVKLWACSATRNALPELLTRMQSWDMLLPVNHPKSQLYTEKACMSVLRLFPRALQSSKGLGWIFGMCFGLVKMLFDRVLCFLATIMHSYQHSAWWHARMLIRRHVAN